MLNFSHNPVLLNECTEGLDIKPDGIYIDGTIGGGGHGAAIAEKLDTNGLLIGIDRDEAAISAAKIRLQKFHNTKLIKSNHDNIRQVLENLKIEAADGFLLDLGVSSHQLDSKDRGFSYRWDAPLDMRMDTCENITAYDIINGYSEGELVKILFEYGEERYAKKIVKKIIAARPVKTTLQLVSIIESALPYTPPAYGHPAMRTFQAIRIVVNKELILLGKTIKNMVELLKPKGRICIISFHSLEDRIVKTSFKKMADPCECPKSMPYCVCGKQPEIKIISRKPIRPGADETAENPRSKSAKLRIAEKLSN